MSVASRQLRVGALVILVAALTVLLGAGPASAHDDLIGSTPGDGDVVSTAPTTMVLEFFEPIDRAGPEMVLRDDQDDVVETLDPMIDDRTLTGALPTGLPDGTYSVAWRVTSDDGHPAEGTTRFAIGEASTSMDYSGDTSSSTGFSVGASTLLALVIGAVSAALAVVVLVVRRRPRRSAT